MVAKSSNKSAKKAVQKASHRAAVKTPEMPAVIARLNEEHRYIASVLEALQAQADLLKPGSVPDYDMLYDMMHYMVSYPDEYHHPREDIVFNRLLERNAGSEKVLKELWDGHEQMYRRSSQLLKYLAKIRNKKLQPDKAHLKKMLDDYIKYYRDHIDTEEGKVFPEAIASLADADWSVLAEESEQVDDPLFGAKIRRRYQRLADHLRERAGIVSDDIVIAEIFGIEALMESVTVFAGVSSDLVSTAGEFINESWRDNWQECQTRLRSGEVAKIVGLPWALVQSNCSNLRAAGNASRKIWNHASESLTEPYRVRLDYFKKLPR